MSDQGKWLKIGFHAEGDTRAPRPQGPRRYQVVSSLLTFPALARTSTRIGRREMQKKLTITIDEEVYEGLHKIIGPRKISRFVQEIVRPHVIRPNLEAAYAEMGKDKRREKEAEEWAESTFKDLADETE
jgi:predicted CopG family antitoxin